MPFDGLPPPPKPIPAAEILLHVEVKFLMNAWIWVGRNPEGGGYRNQCLVTAIARATEEKKLDREQRYAALELVAKVIGTKPYKPIGYTMKAIAGWNDTEGRTFADIICVLRDAQKLAYSDTDAAKGATQQELEPA